MMVVNDINRRPWIYGPSCVSIGKCFPRHTAKKEGRYANVFVNARAIQPMVRSNDNNDGDDALFQTLYLFH